jgi:hypothetical protein
MIKKKESSYQEKTTLLTSPPKKKKKKPRIFWIQLDLFSLPYDVKSATFQRA